MIRSIDQLCKCLKQDECAQNIWEYKGNLLNCHIRRTQIVAKLLESDEFSTIIDIGCAEGFITSILSNKFHNIIGIDINLSSLNIASDKVKNAQFSLVTITNLPFKRNSIDAIYILEVFEHLPIEMIEKGVSEITRILKSNGQLIISVPYKERINFIQCKNCGKLKPENIAKHLNSYDEESFFKILPRQYHLEKKYIMPNFGIISCSFFLRPLPLELWLPINNILRKVRNGPWIIFKYRKESN